MAAAAELVLPGTIISSASAAHRKSRVATCTQWCCCCCCTAAAVLLAGEDLVYMVPNKIYSSQRYGDTAAVLRASLTSGRIAMPAVHKRMGFSDSAMAAAQVSSAALACWI
jgi:hypothetical protein